MRSGFTVRSKEVPTRRRPPFPRSGPGGSGTTLGPIDANDGRNGQAKGGDVAAVPPEDLFTVETGLPDLTGSVLLEMLDGFIDAGAARRLSREHLLSAGESRVVARFDVDLLHDYRARRPPM